VLDRIEGRANQRLAKMEFELLYTVVTPGLEQGHVTLLPELQDLANYPIVWVEAQRFVAVWRDSIDAFNDIEPYESWTEAKQTGMHNFLADTRTGYARTPPRLRRDTLL
jgi:hypothetical protein